jgi:hypothetical protein
VSAKLAAQTQKAAGIGNGMRTATVAAVGGSSVTLSINGGQFSSGVGVLGDYTPVVGDTVAVFRQDSSWLILGKVSPVGGYDQVLIDQLTGASSSATGTGLVTVLSVTLPVAGTYVYDAQLNMTNTVTAGIPGVGIGGTSTPTAWRWASQTTVYQQAAGSQGFFASGTAYPSVGQALSQANWPVTSGFTAARILGQVTVSAPGTLTMGISETVAGTATAQNGSILTVRRAV